MAQPILVIGATGAQGGSVARHLLRRGHRVRALTRTPAIAEAVQLRMLGAEIVRGDLFDGDSVLAAMRGVDGVFGVTSYWEHFEREAELGSNLVTAAARAHVRHLVLSTQPHVGGVTDGELNVPHFDLKAQTAARALALGVPTTLVQPAFFYENLTTFFVPQRRTDGSWELALPLGDAKLAGFAAEDLGGAVAPLFEHPAQFIGRTLRLAGDELTARQYAAALSRATETLIRYRDVPHAEFASYGFRGAEHIADEFRFHRLHAPDAAADRLRTRQLYPAVQGFEQWAWRNVRRIEQALAA